MSKSRARLLAELLNAAGRVKKDKSDLAGADSVIDLDTLPTITNAKLENSSVTIAGEAVSLGASLSLNTGHISEHTNYKYYTDSRARAAISVDGNLSYNSSTGVLSYTTPTTIASLSNHDTDDLSEGTNLYFTNARARGAISVGGNSLSYNSSTGVITSNYEESPSFTGTVTAQTLSINTNTVGTTTDIALTDNAAIVGNSSISWGLTSTSGYYRWLIGNTSRTGGTAGGSEKMKLDASGNLTLSGTVDGRDIASDGSKLDGIATNANNYVLPTATSSAIGGVKIGYSENGKNYPVELSSGQMYVNVPWVDTNTTYSVGDGGLTQKNFTTTLKNKLDGIATNANNYVLPFTDNSSNWNTAYGWGNHASQGYITNSTASLDASKITGGTLNFARIPYPVNGDWWNNGFVRVGTDGVMEVGKYLDFHTADSGGGTDYDVRVTASSGAIDIDGDLTVDDVTISGNLTVQGTTTTLNTATLDVEDKNITLNYGTGDTSGSADGAGITIQDAVNSTTNATILWNATADQFDFSHKINISGNLQSWNVYSQDFYVLNTAGDGWHRWGERASNRINLNINSLETYAASYLTGGSSTTPAVHIRSSGSSWSEGLAVHPLSNSGYALAFFRTKSSYTDQTNTWAIGNLGGSGYQNYFGLLRKGLTGGVADRTSDAPFTVSPSGTFKFGFNPYVGSNKIWHAGNDGASSGLDADTLDGIHGDAFLRSNATDVASGKITLQYGETSDLNSIGGSRGVTAFHTANVGQTSNRPDSGNYATGLEFTYYDASARSQLAAGSGGSNNTAAFYVRSEAWGATNSWTSWYKLFHTGNDGSGSGLDADTLDGQQGSYYQNASNINAGTLADARLGGTVFRSRGSVNVTTSSGGSNSNPFDDAHTETKVAEYGTRLISYTGASATMLTIATGGSASVFQIGAHYNGNNFYMRTRTDSSNWQTWKKLWHTGNDGSGSGLDADTLDGQHKAYFEMPISPLTQNGNMNSVSAPAGQYASVQFYNMYTPSGSGNQSNYNVPEDGGSHYHVQQFNGYSNSYNNWKYQIAHSFYNGKMYHRNQYDTTWQGWATVWDSDSDGTGSGLDADTVDGIQGSQFLRSDANDTATGVITFSGATQLFRKNDATNYYTGSLMVESYGGASSIAAMGFHISGQLGRMLSMNSSGLLSWEDDLYTAGYVQSNSSMTAATTVTASQGFVVPNTSQYGLRSNNGNNFFLPLDQYNNMHIRSTTGSEYHDSTAYYFRKVNQTNLVTITNSGLNVATGNLTRASNTVWDAGNDGSGTGLDADTVDGLQAADFRQDKWYSFTVGGDLDKFYPVLFTVSAAGNHAGEILEITQNNVHQNGSNHGAFYAKFSINTTGWGHIPALMLLLEYSKTGNTYISKHASVDHNTSKVGVWLRGSTNYQYRSADGAIFDSVRCTDNQPYKSYDHSNDAYDITISHSTTVENAIFNDSAHNGKVLNTGNISSYAVDKTSTQTIGGSKTFTGSVVIEGNTTLGNASGDYTHVNDTLYVGATDSGDSHIYFGENSSNWYGEHWYWDSGHTTNRYSRHAGTDTLIEKHDTRNTYKIQTARAYERLNPIQGYQIGSYNSHGGNASYTNPIYVIGDNYRPTTSSIAGMYGIGYAHPNLWGSDKTSDWGLYVVNNGSVDATIGAGSITAWFKNDVKISTTGAIRTNRYENTDGTFMFQWGTNSGTSGFVNFSDSTSDPSTSAAASNARGITWGQRTDNNPYYMIYPRYYANGNSTHSRLVLGWHTGVEIGGSSTYGGTRFFNDAPFNGSEIMSVGKGDSHVRVVNNLYVGATLDVEAKQNYFGVSSSWDSVGFGHQTNVHFQGHNQFWIGAGNGTWFAGAANSRSQATGLAPDGGSAHDLLLTTMPATSSYSRGITFGVDNNGAGTGGWRLGKWHSGDARDSSKLVVDGQIFAKGGYTDEYDYYANDYSAYYSAQGGTAQWTGDGGWQVPGIVSSTAIQIQSGNGATNSRKPQLQFHQYGYGGIVQEYDGPNKIFHIKQTGNHRLNHVEITTNYGNLQMGPMNSSYCHIYTNRPAFYFNKTNLYADGNTILHDGNIQGAMGATSYKQWSGLNASATQAKRYTIMRLYVCPAHWDSNHQNIKLFLHEESYESSYAEYHLWSDYNGGNQNTAVQLHVKDVGGYDYSRYRVVVGSPVDAGYDYSGQNVYYYDIYVDVAYYKQVRAYVHTRGHGYVTTNPTSGGATTVVYNSPSSSNISDFTDNKTVHIRDDLYVNGTITASNNITAYSDVSLKENIEEIPEALQKVEQIRGVTFTRNDEDSDRRHTGVIAQEIEQVLPEVVDTDDDGLKSVAYGNITGLLIEAIKELKQEVDDLKAQLKEK